VSFEIVLVLFYYCRVIIPLVYSAVFFEILKVYLLQETSWQYQRPHSYSPLLQSGRNISFLDFLQSNLYSRYQKLQFLWHFLTSITGRKIVSWQ